MGYGEGAMVEVEVEVVEQEFVLFEASTLVRGFSIGNIVVDMVGKEG